MHLHSIHLDPEEYKSDLSIKITLHGCLIQVALVSACFFPVINDFLFFFSLFPPFWVESFMSPCGVFTQKIIQSIVAQQLMRLVVK